MRRALEYDERPEVLKRPEVKGVFVGACVEGYRFRRLASLKKVLISGSIDKGELR